MFTKEAGHHGNNPTRRLQHTTERQPKDHRRHHQRDTIEAPPTIDHTTTTLLRDYCTERPSKPSAFVFCSQWSLAYYGTAALPMEHLTERVNAWSNETPQHTEHNHRDHQLRPRGKERKLAWQGVWHENTKGTAQFRSFFVNVDERVWSWDVLVRQTSRPTYWGDVCWRGRGWEHIWLCIVA